MYAETGSDGKRRYTVDEIAGTFAVSRKTIYRHLDKNHAQRQSDERRGRGPSPPETLAPPPLRSRSGRPAPRWRGPAQRGVPASPLPRWPALPADTSPPAGPKRSGNARISRWSGSTKTAHPGRSASTGTARAANPVECGTVECAHRGDGPVRAGALVDQLRKHNPNQPTALRAWLRTSHGWQLEPEPLCPAHSNSIKD